MPTLYLMQTFNDMVYYKDNGFFLLIQTLFQLMARAMQMVIIYAVAEAVTPVVNGNITEIRQNGKLINKYTYDSLNELKEEYDYVNKFYINYSYDGAGNLQNKYEQVLDPNYGYPTGTQNGNTYEYTDTSWKDKLTKVNSSNISYDANGNPLTYRDGMSFEWENGRILLPTNPFK